jgi:hypothetical protein
MTLEIIGVTHDGKEIADAVMDYIDINHSSLESIMLEIPQGWQVFYNEFFGPMAKHYLQQGKNVIEGDRKYWDIMGTTYEEALAAAKKDFNKFKRKQTLYHFLGFLNGRATFDRHRDMNLMLHEENPDIVVVGSAHASYLKNTIQIYLSPILLTLHQ